jgi:hypothetical protein
MIIFQLDFCVFKDIRTKQIINYGMKRKKIILLQLSVNIIIFNNGLL